MALMSTPVASSWANGVIRCPSIRTSVRTEPRPRSETDDCPYEATPASAEPLIAPVLAVAEIVWMSCSMFCTPLRAMSSLVRTCTGSD